MSYGAMHAGRLERFIAQGRLPRRARQERDVLVPLPRLDVPAERFIDGLGLPVADLPGELRPSLADFVAARVSPPAEEQGSDELHNEQLAERVAAAVLR